MILFSAENHKYKTLISRHGHKTLVKLKSCHSLKKKKIKWCYSSPPDVGFLLHIILVWKTGWTCPTTFLNMTNSSYVSIADQLKAFPQASTHTGITLNQQQVLLAPLLRIQSIQTPAVNQKITLRLL